MLMGDLNAKLSSGNTLLIITTKVKGSKIYEETHPRNEMITMKPVRKSGSDEVFGHVL